MKSSGSHGNMFLLVDGFTVVQLDHIVIIRTSLFLSFFIVTKGLSIGVLPSIPRMP